MEKEEKDKLVKELCVELRAKLDGGRKNLIVPVCPYCGKAGGKFGIYVGPETSRKKLFISHCFSCGVTKNLDQLLDDIGRPDLKIKEYFKPAVRLEIPDFYRLDNDEEIDDSLVLVDMPEGWRRTSRNQYLNQRGFTREDYRHFPVGTTRGLNWKYDGYVVFPIIDRNDIVGYISRHTMSKADIDEYNAKARKAGKYEIRRYNNSTENDFSKLLYNYDAVIQDETDTVIIVEGVFDVIALTRKLNLYDNPRIAVVATFGKKISDIQIFKLQDKGVETVVIGYDGDAVESINKAAKNLSQYFSTYIAYIENPEDDFDSMDFWDIYDTFSVNLKTPIEYKLNTVQE